MKNDQAKNIRYFFSVKQFQSPLSDILLLLLATLLLLFIYTFFVPQATLNIDSTSNTVIIQKGMSVRSIGHLLKKNGIISGIPQFVFAAKLLGKEGDLQAGRYTFPERNSIVSILSRLMQGEIEFERVTIPEGLIIREVAHRLKAGAAIDSMMFLRLANNPAYIHTLGIEANSLEGYLFPSTYNVRWEMDPREVIDRMVDAFQKVFNEDCERRARELRFSVQDVLTLASIIEKEVKLSEERPIISAVFHNRLKLGRALESCATVEYALGVHKPRLTEEDLQVQSLYNTYVHAGLPPGPICNPGKASIEAALYPADVDYLYFVSEGNGRHIFSRSLEEHARAKQRVKKSNSNATN